MELAPGGRRLEVRALDTGRDKGGGKKARHQEH